MSPRLAISQTFQFAQKCFSFDNTLQEYAVDDDFEDDDDDDDGDDVRVARMRRKLMMPPSDRHFGGTHRLTPRIAPLDTAASFGGHRHQQPHIPGIRHSQSWDVGSSHTNVFKNGGMLQPTNNQQIIWIYEILVHTRTAGLGYPPPHLHRLSLPKYYVDVFTPIFHLPNTPVSMHRSN